MVSKSGFGEHFGHHFLFVFANAVFAGDRAAGGNAQFENIVGEGFGRFFLAGNAAVVKNQRWRLPSPAWNTLATRRPAS